MKLIVDIKSSDYGPAALSGNNTYTGGTVVNNGTLMVANANGSATGIGNVTLNGGTLASATGGSISGCVLAGNGMHTIAPGGIGAIGTLNVGGLSTFNKTTLNFDVGSTQNSNGVYLGGDLLNVGSGGLTVGPTTQITFGANPAMTGYYRLIGGAISGARLSNFALPAPPTVSSTG